jgi:hypothetical protein
MLSNGRKTSKKKPTRTGLPDGLGKKPGHFDFFSKKQDTFDFKGKFFKKTGSPFKKIRQIEQFFQDSFLKKSTIPENPGRMGALHKKDA